MRLRTHALLFVFLSVSPLTWAKEKLTLKAIFAGDPLEGVPPRVTFLPDGSGLLLLQTEGQDKVLVEENWEGKRREILRQSELIAEEHAGTQLPLSSFQVSPDGRLLLLTHEGDLFTVDLHTKAVRRLTRTPEEEELASFSPNGQWVSFVRGNDLYVLELASGTEHRLTSDGSETRLNGKLDWVYTEELYNRNEKAYAWSPDSRFFLYLSFDLASVPTYPLVDLSATHPTVTLLRYPKAGDPNAAVTVTVTSLPDGGKAPPESLKLSFSGPRREYVARFGWLPAGQGFWLLLLDRGQQNAELVTFDWPWGASRLVLAEHDEAWLNVEDDILWTQGGVLLFGSERSGFRHLYRLDPSSREPVALTSGPWEVTEVLGLSKDERFVYFTATEASPLERHLYRVPVAGGTIERLTRERGTHALRAAPGCSAFLDTYSTATRLPEFRLLGKEGQLLRSLAYEKPPQLDRYQLGSVDFLTLAAEDGTPLYASLVKPATFNPKRRYPVVVYVYGGPHAQVVRDGWGGRTALFHHFLAEQGFLVFSLDNRGSAGRGRAFERALLRRFGRVELADQLAGVAWLAQQPFVDPSRVGIWGWSYGGFMTLYALTHSTAFRAGAAVAPVTDWRLYDTIYTERYLKLPAENPEGYRDSSPLSAAGKLAAPLFIAHGTGDDNVHWQNTLNFIGELTKAQKPYLLHLYPNRNHGIPGKEERFHLFTAIYEHFRKHLQAGAATH
ncbi:MAG: S9 family peptidase [Thermoanaerobaculum sp.]